MQLQRMHASMAHFEHLVHQRSTVFLLSAPRTARIDATKRRKSVILCRERGHREDLNGAQTDLRRPSRILHPVSIASRACAASLITVCSDRFEGVIRLGAQARLAVDTGCSLRGDHVRNYEMMRI